MDSKEIRSILSRSGVGIWALIEAAIVVATLDYGEELRHRRDRIVESLYAPSSQLCQNCSGGVHDDGDRDGRFYNRSNKTNNSSDDVDNKDDHGNNKKFIVDDDKDKRNLNVDFSKSPLIPESNHRNFGGGEEEEEDVDPYGGLFVDEQTKFSASRSSCLLKKQLKKTILPFFFLEKLPIWATKQALPEYKNPFSLFFLWKKYFAPLKYI